MERGEAGDVSDQAQKTNIVQAPLFPTYADLRSAIRALDGEPVRRVRDMMTALFDQTGTPQSPVDWSDVDFH